MTAVAGNTGTRTRIVRAYWNDGLLDILAGLGVLLIGVAWQFDLVALGAIAPALLMPFWKPLRARLTEPRLGYVELSDEQEGHHHRFLIGSLIAGCLTLVAGVAVYSFSVRSGSAVDFRFIAALPAVLVAVMATMTAAITSVNRFLLVAAVLVVSGVVVGSFDLDPGVALISGGTAGLALGLAVLYRFLRRHPLDPADEDWRA